MDGKVKRNRLIAGREAFCFDFDSANPFLLMRRFLFLLPGIPQHLPQFLDQQQPNICILDNHEKLFVTGIDRTLLFVASAKN